MSIKILLIKPSIELKANASGSGFIQVIFPKPSGLKFTLVGLHSRPFIKTYPFLGSLSGIFRSFMASLSEATLISKLESSDLSKIHSLFSDYLLPFKDLTSPKRKPSKSSALTLTRSLAKQFLPFLNRCLSILPKRLAVPSDLENKQFGLELFDVHKLCLNCLESVSSQLSCKPYVVYLQRLRLVHCLAAWGRHGEAEKEALWVLERLRGVDLGVKEWGKFLPGAVENGDGELAALLVEVVAMVVKCLATGQSKDERDYGKVVDLVEEVRPWFRFVKFSSKL